MEQPAHSVFTANLDEKKYSTHSPLHIYLLGRFLLLLGETPLTTITVPRVQSLLAYLVLNRNTPQNRSHLAFLLWPDSTEAQAHTNLRQLLHHLRQALPNSDQFLAISKQSLQWLPTQAERSGVLDIQAFEQACIQAKQAEHVHDMVGLQQALEQALHLYHGDLLPGCYEEWIIPERDRLRQMFLQAAERLSALLEEERAYPIAITVAQTLLHQDPLREATYQQLMRLHALRGDRAAALRVYHTCAKILERELGTEPSAITQAAYELLMHPEHAHKSQADLLPKQRTEAPLQGRKAEWQRLQKAWNTATGGIAGRQSGHPHFVLLSGEAGIGKTRLAQELSVWVSRLGMTTASARCYATLEHLAYAPLTAWLRSTPLQANLSILAPTSLTEIARLIPEVLIAHPHLSPPTAMTEGWQRQFFFAALVHAILSTHQPLLLLLDDLQWCDQETLEWLQYLFRFAPDARLLLVATVRMEEVSPAHPLTAFLSTLQRDGLATDMPLTPLTLTETSALAEYLLGSQLDPVLSNKLYQETEGNPFFVVEMAQAQASAINNDAHNNLVPQYSPLPPSVQAVLTMRLIQLSEHARIVANVAAIIGREFAFPVLAHASRESEEMVVQGLDELWHKRIVREHDTGMTNAYDFSHNKLRVQISTSLSRAQRRLLHQRVAEAFAAVYSAEQDTVCGQIASHYEQAGLPAQAIPFYQQAGKVASRIYAHAEAQHAFERAATLLATSHNVPWETIAQVYTSLGDVYGRRGFHEEARQAYQQAMSNIPPNAHIWQARLHWKSATTWVYSSTSDHDPCYLKSLQEFEVAERILTRIANPTHPDWRDEWLALQFTRIWRGSTDDIKVALAKARPVVEQHGTQEQRKLFTESVGIYNAIRERYVIPASRLAAWRATIAALEPTDNEAQRGIDLAVLGIGLVCAAQFDEAEEQLCQALRLGERTGNAWVQNNCLTFLSFVFRGRGQVAEMRLLLTQAQSIGIAPYNRILAGHAAWIAWREGKLALAETAGRETVQELAGSDQPAQQIRPNPFLWVGRWPLIGVAIAQNQISTAINEVRQLFDPTQQPPREPLGTLLEAALHSWDAGNQAKVHLLLQEIQPLAEQMGYL